MIASIPVGEKNSYSIPVVKTLLKLTTLIFSLFSLRHCFCCCTYDAISTFDDLEPPKHMPEYTLVVKEVSFLEQRWQ
jgi:hypothetical protein